MHSCVSSCASVSVHTRANFPKARTPVGKPVWSLDFGITDHASLAIRLAEAVSQDFAWVVRWIHGFASQALRCEPRFGSQAPSLHAHACACIHACVHSRRPRGRLALASHSPRTLGVLPRQDNSRPGQGWAATSEAWPTELRCGWLRHEPAALCEPETHPTTGAPQSLPNTVVRPEHGPQNPN